MSNFIKLIFPFIIFITSQCNALDYIHAQKKWIQVIPSKEVQNVGMDEFAACALRQMNKKEAQKLDYFIRCELPSGSCYGQSYVFMLLNPPSIKQIAFPTSKKDQKRVVWFQAKLGAMVFFNPQHQTLRNQAIQVAWEGNLYKNFNKVSDEQLIELVTSLSQKKAFKERCKSLIKEFNDLHPSMVFLEELELEEEKILKEKDLKLIDDVVTRCDDQNHALFKTLFQKRLAQIYAEKKATDLIVGFDFDYEGQRGGHAILIQLKHLRVYDAMRGIFQYASFEDLKKDLKITQQSGCTYFHISAFGLN